ncbi:hypothetical protein NK718_13525 [Alsobacter sp. SYSU M60028]|uniref:Type II secretion system protein GspD n=1 Tax=Alsobacter ponti TaxID=2962936 RepID=A0ABT1LDE9_9HYPH|nr:secretin N-terminal domain-containing protein [Alsobacter ponti]MCP8939541.1 hypothetical protein [Alsobacter ponti]
MAAAGCTIAPDCTGGEATLAECRPSLAQPALWTGEPVPKTLQGPAFERGNAAPRQIAAWSGKLRVSVSVTEEQRSADMAEAAQAGGGFAPEERVSVNVSGLSLAAFLRQMMKGSLGLNYVAPDDMVGSVTLRTEEPIAKADLLQVVRDVLARNGYAMKLSGNLYHIDRPEVLARVASEGETGSRFVRLRGGRAAGIVPFARQALPVEVQVSTTGSPDTVLLRGPVSLLGAAEEFLNAIPEAAVRDDRVAIVPVRTASPEKAAAQINLIYRNRTGAAGEEAVTASPLPERQAVLIVARDASYMEGARRLLTQVDAGGGDDVTMRVIALRYLQPQDIAPQLQALFAAGPQASSPPREAAPAQAGGRAAARSGGAAAATVARFSPSAAPLGDTEEPTAANASAVTFTPPARSRDAAGSATALEPASPLGAAVPSVLDQPVRVVADPRNNTLLVSSSYATFNRMRDIVRRLDVPQSQVVIEASIIEVQINDQLSQGVQFFLQGNGILVRSSNGNLKPDVTGAGGVIGVTGELGGYQIDAVIKALREITRVRVVSSPYLSVVDGKTAKLVVGDQIPYSSRTQQSSATGTLTVTEEVETKDTGVVLEVTPRINADNSVILSISQSVSKAQDSALLGNKTPVISTRNVQSQIAVQSGHTAVLGGLLQDKLEQQETGVAGLSSVPLLGSLFKSSQDRPSRVELLLLITPRVARRSHELDDITTTLRMTMQGLSKR